MIGYSNTKVTAIDCKSKFNKITSNSNQVEYSGGFFGYVQTIIEINSSESSNNLIISYSSEHESYSGGFFGWNGYSTKLVNSTSTKNFISANSDSIKGYSGAFFAKCKNTHIFIYLCVSSLNQIYGRFTGYYWGVLNGWKTKYFKENLYYENLCNLEACEEGKVLNSSNLITIIIVVTLSASLKKKNLFFLFLLF